LPGLGTRPEESGKEGEKEGQQEEEESSIPEGFGREQENSKLDCSGDLHPRRCSLRRLLSSPEMEPIGRVSVRLKDSPCSVVLGEKPIVDRNTLDS